jgi:hypothetical protein
MMESERRRPFDRRDGRDGISGARLTILRLADHRLIPPLRASGAAASPGALCGKCLLPCTSRGRRRGRRRPSFEWIHVGVKFEELDVRDRGWIDERGRRVDGKRTFGGLKAYLRATDHTSSNIISRDSTCAGALQREKKNLTSQR